MTAPILTVEMAQAYVEWFLADAAWKGMKFDSKKESGLALDAIADGRTICVDAAQYQRLRESHAELLEIVKEVSSYLAYRSDIAGEEVVATAEALIKELK